jgi:hypothetical protein
MDETLFIKRNNTVTIKKGAPNIQLLNAKTEELSFDQLAKRA